MQALILFLVLGMTPNEQLIDAGRDLQVSSIMTGQQHPTLQKMAESVASMQASIKWQYHWEWNQRFDQLQNTFPGMICKEVVNESWPGQDQEAAAREMYRSWERSSGHWSGVNGPCKYYGYAMCRGKNGVWYACGIFAK